jgi:hypothetical protein
MGSLLDFIGGVADHYDKEAERKRRQEEADADMERQYKLTSRLEEFRDKLQEERLKRTPKETRLNKGMVEILNANGEVIGTREATERELQADQLNSQKLQGELEDTSPQMREQKRADDRAKLEADLVYKHGAADSSRASAERERAQAGLIGEQQRILRESGAMPGGRRDDPLKRTNELSDNYLKMLADPATDPSIRNEIARTQAAITVAAGRPEVIAELEAALAQRIAELSGQ